MASFGSCGEPSCIEYAVRLFHCAHHCMKSVCLQHLIEHDRLMNYDEQYLNNMREELKELWLTYSSFIDEPKLYYEFEQRLKTHKQLIQDVAILLENNSLNIEQYRLTLEKLEKNIQQEKYLHQHASKSGILVEPPVKIEPTEEYSIVDETDLSNNNSFATVIESQIRDHLVAEQNKENFIPLWKFSGTCPFWLDGVFGLTQKDHGMYLCSYEKYHCILYRHLIKCHKLIPSIAKKICRILQNNQNSHENILFQPNDIVIDQINNFRCPFSIYDHSSSSIIDMSLERRCRSKKPLRTDYLRYHLIHFHGMAIANANKLMHKLKVLSKNLCD